MSQILLVDDSATQALNIQYFLQQSGFEVAVAHDGREALEMIERDEPDIVLTDLQMPNLNGLQLVKELKTVSPTLPVVLMTANGSEEIALEALQAGAADYIPKRLLEREIVRILHGHLENVAASQAQERMNSLLTRLENQFELTNDPGIVSILIATLEADIRRFGLKDESLRLRIATALREAIENAIYHGNLEVSSKLRETEQPTYYTVAEERRSQEPYASRRVSVTSTITPKQAKFVIRDQGPGFDPTTIPDPTSPENVVNASGRGLMLITTFMDEVHHNDAGNEITIIKKFG